MYNSEVGDVAVRCLLVLSWFGFSCNGKVMTDEGLMRVTGLFPIYGFGSGSRLGVAGMRVL